MQYTLMLWHADHVNFGRLLNLLEGELDLLHDAGSPHYQLMLDIMYYMTHYSDVLHHPKEDLVFARMKARDENIGPTIDELTIQHTQLRDMGESMVRALDDVVNGSITSRERIEATARAYVSALRAHMRTEESEILPRAGRLLSESDWTEIDAAIANFDDPLFGSEVQERYAGLREQINRQAQANGAMAR
jgi:hemerythrin-like domain-containing protein